jgi:phosphatidate cytidylyltransferase
VPPPAVDARITTGVVLAVSGLVATLLLPTAALAAVLLVIVLLGAWEWARLTGLARPTSRLAYIAVIALAAYGTWWLSLSQPLLPLVTGMVWWIVALALLAIYRPGVWRGPFVAWGLRTAGLTAFLPAWIALVELHRFDPRPAWLLFLMGLVWLADSAAFFAGRRFGQTRLAPVISPAKTREGVWGALVANGVLAVLGAWWFELPRALWLYFIGLCLVTTLWSVTGDLFESLLKRLAGVKDSGDSLPGHGGILDRIDSSMAAAPPFVLGLHWMNY